MTTDATAASKPDRERIALGIRQPWAELILRGSKTLEIRSMDTRVRGMIYVYTSKVLAEIPAAREALQVHQIDPARLIRGQIVGTVEIAGTHRCVASDAASACVPPGLLQDKWAWELANPRRLDEPLSVRFLPYGVWFYPFRRRNASSAHRRTR